MMTAGAVFATNNEQSMCLQNQRTISLLRKNYPHIWQLLNRRAKLNPPSGLTGFISGDEATVGRRHLRLADRRIQKLITKISAKVVGDAYRRDLSRVQNQDALAEILCEITLVDSLGGISSGCPVLRPRTTAGTACDVKIVVDGNDIYCEIKRFADDFP